MTELFFIIILLAIFAGVGIWYFLLNKKERDQIEDIVEDAVKDAVDEIPTVSELKKMTKAKLKEFADQNNLIVDIKKKKDEIIEDIRKQF